MTTERAGEEWRYDRLFQEVESLAIDPVFSAVLEDIANAQEEINTTDQSDKESAEDGLDRLNELWLGTRWPGTVAFVTGKLRFVDEQHIIPENLKTMPLQTDIYGEYYEVSALPLVCAYIADEHDDASM